MAGDRALFDKTLSEGHSAAWEQNWEDAIRFYRQAVSEFPESPDGVSSLAFGTNGAWGLRGSVALLSESIGLKPDDPFAFANMAKILERIGKPREAFQNYLRGAELFLKEKLVDQCVESFQHGITLQPDNLNARVRLASIYDRLGRKKEAADEYIAIASLMQAGGDVQKAIQAVQYALQLVPGYAPAMSAFELLETNYPLPEIVRPKGSTGPMGMAKVREMEEKEGTERVVERDPIAEARHLSLVRLAGNLFTQEEEAQASGEVSRRGISALTKGTGGLSTDRSANPHPIAPQPFDRFSNSGRRCTGSQRVGTRSRDWAAQCGSLFQPWSSIAFQRI